MMRDTKQPSTGDLRERSGNLEIWDGNRWLFYRPIPPDMTLTEALIRSCVPPDMTEAEIQSQVRMGAAK